MSTLNPKIKDWRGRRVWLIGASSGIGAALAMELSRLGAQVAISARSVAALQALNMDSAILLPCDVTDNVSLAGARHALIGAWGSLDLVIYLAGDYVPMTVQNFDLARAEQVIDVNFNGALRVFAAIMPDLKAGGGIAFMASVAGYRGLPKSLCYGPGKAALIHFAECLHLDLQSMGIGVWVVNPGFVQTRLTAGNKFTMPALLTPHEAATATVEGFATGEFEIHFPKRFSRVVKLLSLLPYRHYFPLIRRITGS